MASSEATRQAIEAARAGRKVEARDLLLKVVESDPYDEMAWLWLSGLVDSLEDKIIACENVLTINPANEKVRAYLSRLRQQQSREMDAVKVSAPPPILPKPAPPSGSNAKQPLKDEDPMRVAARLEQEGRFDEALEIYKVQAGKAKDSFKFDQIYKQIVRIENLQREKISFIPPRLTILRLTLTWPLAYFTFILLHAGFNPIAHPNFILWLGLPVVAVGSFLLAVSEIRSHHTIWKRLFDDDGDGSNVTRLIAAAMGWLLVIFPHVFLVLNALLRLRNFDIPFNPF